MDHGDRGFDLDIRTLTPMVARLRNESEGSQVWALAPLPYLGAESCDVDLVLFFFVGFWVCSSTRDGDGC